MATPDQKSELILTTLDKGLRVLETLATPEVGDGYTLTELSAVMGIHRSTLFRLLTTLQLRGYVSRDRDTDRYTLGLRTLSISSALLRNLDYREVSRSVLQRLADDTQELIHLVRLDGDSVVTIDRIQGSHPLSLQTQIGERRPAYCTASGKAMLAFMNASEVDDILAAGMPVVTLRTITSPELMRDHLAEVRRRGYAWDDEERVEGVRCVAAAVRGHDGSVVGALSIAAPAVRTPLDRLASLGEEVRVSAEEVSQQLGYQAPSTDGDGRIDREDSLKLRGPGSE